MGAVQVGDGGGEFQGVAGPRCPHPQGRGKHGAHVQAVVDLLAGLPACHAEGPRMLHQVHERSFTLSQYTRATSCGSVCMFRCLTRRRGGWLQHLVHRGMGPGRAAQRVLKEQIRWHWILDTHSPGPGREDRCFVHKEGFCLQWWFRECSDA